MPNRLLILVWAALGWSLVAVAEAQQTPPIAPQTQETPVPPPVVIPTIPLPADVPNRPLTADEAARIALRRQPTVAVARAGIATAQGRTQQVRSGLLPTVGLTGSYSNVSILSGQGGGVIASTGGGLSSTGFLTTATLRQLIFDFNHTRDLVRQAAALERVATQQLTRVQYDLILQVKQAFYFYVQDSRLVTVNEGNLQNRQSQLALARARFNSGLGLPSDLVTAETAVSEAVLNLNVARNNATVSAVSLATLLGIDPRTPIQAGDTDELPFASNDVNALIDTALRQRPELLQAQAMVQANQYAVSAARTTNAPVLSGSLGVSSRGADFPPRDDFFTVGAAITFTPFDGGLTAGRVKEARANLDAAQAELLSAQLTVKLDVAQAYLNMRSAEQRVVIANIDVANATEGVRIASGRYSAGLGLFLDIINAQTQLLTARTNLVTAQAAVDQARAAIQRALGSPLPVPR